MSFIYVDTTAHLPNRLHKNILPKRLHLFFSCNVLAFDLNFDLKNRINAFYYLLERTYHNMRSVLKAKILGHLIFLNDVNTQCFHIVMHREKCINLRWEIMITKSMFPEECPSKKTYLYRKFVINFTLDGKLGSYQNFFFLILKVFRRCKPPMFIFPSL